MTRNFLVRLAVAILLAGALAGGFMLIFVDHLANVGVVILEPRL